ncbi:hypothetical protein ACIRPU_38160 [Streptomyces sp. NPDC102259]|uniref:hypothetical protein n=1 Tax=Streptomyces sp. NPDC102259 TaxID=3366148 RepID=UPI00382EB200
MCDGLFDVGGTGLYHEVRGSGPALLMISGAGGDAGAAALRVAATQLHGAPVPELWERVPGAGTGQDTAQV